ncbi:6,7-dimethyl-8-ribityllumazine synthase [Paracoccus marinaquae]|uniref:6,7-dimethyl-8-ribityllumazine synthase n=1 Tax=Paracoccus marinaquae TaxID=2841926 RepID=A0ABS6AFT0_9RHOB|nr:6,7-dimethyl-8-ribityllumazine synthase [Paracoccus marinaquae]MBU3029373.1 6,7-dimethyl-8-ribityllumazine synthase [Paracoccus marinaquae]
MTNTNPRIAFIKARWHADIVDRAHEGFLAEAAKLISGAQIDSFDVPGAFEMPLLAKKLALSGAYDAIVAAAFVVDGGIYRHDFVAGAVVTGLMNVGLETGVPCFSVSLTPHNYQETEAMTAFFRDHFVRKGAEAAEAVRQVLALESRLAATQRASVA